MNDVALAATVSVGTPSSWGTECAAWVDSRDEQCGRPRDIGFLCKRHHSVAAKRLEKDNAERVRRKEAQERKKRESLEKYGDKWKKQLTNVEAELQRRTGVLTTDTAAFGGVGCAVIEKHARKQFSHSNVKRVGELLRKQKELRRKLGE